MTERTYRLMLGLLMITALLLQLNYAIYVIIGILLFEGISNFRIPILISQQRYGDKPFHVTDNENYSCSINFEAERFYRIPVAFFILFGFVIFPKALWFFPWFIGLNLLLAGISGTCALLILLRKLGFK